MTGQRWFTHSEAADYCRISARTLRRWRTSGRVRAYEGKYSRYDLDRAVRGEPMISIPEMVQTAQAVTPAIKKATEYIKEGIDRDTRLVQVAQDLSRVSGFSLSETLEALKSASKIEDPDNTPVDVKLGPEHVDWNPADSPAWGSAPAYLGPKPRSRTPGVIECEGPGTATPEQLQETRLAILTASCPHAMTMEQWRKYLCLDDNLEPIRYNQNRTGSGPVNNQGTFSGLMFPDTPAGTPEFEDLSGAPSGPSREDFTDDDEWGKF